MPKFSSVKIEELLGLPAIPDSNQFYLIESGTLTQFYLSDSKAQLQLLNATLVDLLPDQTTNANKALVTDGTTASWSKIGLNTHVNGFLLPFNGGTGITTYAQGDLIYASGITTLAKLADVATGNALISGGVLTAPSWGKIGLTTHISGTLGVGNGGTGQTTANAALNALLPSQASNSGKFLATNGTDTSWTSAPVTGSGTANKLPVWATATDLGNSQITDDGANIYIKDNTGIKINSVQAVLIGDYSGGGAGTLFTVDDPTKLIECIGQQINIGNATGNSSAGGVHIPISGDIDIACNSGKLINIGDTAGTGNSSKLTVNDASQIVTFNGEINGTTMTGDWQGNTISVAKGGTGLASYAVGDLLYASGATTLSSLADVATGSALISGGITTAPSWGKIGLTTHISGTLGVANGGTGITSFGTGVATWLGTPTSANLASALTDETGSGKVVFDNAPTFSNTIRLTPGSLSSLGTPADGTMGVANDLSDVTPNTEAAAGGTNVGLLVRCQSKWIIACGA